MDIPTMIFFGEYDSAGELDARVLIKMRISKKKIYIHLNKYFTYLIISSESESSVNASNKSMLAWILNWSKKNLILLREAKNAVFSR